MDEKIETAPCEFLPWDSDFFGVRIARTRVEQLTAETLELLEAWCRREAIRCLYFLARSDDATTVRLAEAHGFQLVDIRVTLETRLLAAAAIHLKPAEVTVALRPAEETDLPTLESIARQSHTQTRFYFDAHFPRARCDDLYATWIRVSCEGYADQVLVADLAGIPSGYISCHLDRNSRVGKIGLLAVAAAAQGHGLGMALVAGALDWFQAEGMTQVTVQTQARNVSAQRLYQRCGFLTKLVQLWYHKWWEEA